MVPIFRINFRMLEFLLTCQLGSKKWGMMPNKRIEDSVPCEIPIIVTEGLFECFCAGSIKPIKTTVKRYCTNDDATKCIVLENGEKVSQTTG
jgi:hypothetical protein